MESLIEEIEQKLHTLPKSKVLEVLDFVDFLAYNKKPLTSQPLEQPLENNLLQEEEAFEAIADQLADELQLYLGTTVLALSDYAVSRAGIYEGHP